MRIWGAVNPQVESIVFSDKATFHLSAKVNRYDVHIWGAANPHHRRTCPFHCTTNCFIYRCILVKMGTKMSLGRLWPSMGLEPRDYIHRCIKTWEYALSNNNSFVVIPFTILFL